MNENEVEQKFIDSHEEIAFRRGYHQGFVAARNTAVSIEAVAKWRHGEEDIAPPGSPWDGFKFT